MMSPPSHCGLKGFESETEKPPHSPVSVMFLSSTLAPQKLNCVLVIPLLHKESLLSSTRSLIFPRSHPGASEAFSMRSSNPLPVHHIMTHHKFPGTQPTQSTESSTALSDLIGSFDFSAPPVAVHLSSIYRTLSH